MPSVKPEAEDAVLNKYAFADQRKDIKEIEPNNEIEKRLFVDILSHVLNNQELNEKSCELIKQILENGQYPDLFVTPKQSSKLYRGMVVKIPYVQSYLSDAQLRVLHEKGTLTINGVFVYSPRNNTSSWTTNDDIIANFTDHLGYEDYSVVLVAKVSDNDRKKFLKLDKLYTKFNNNRMSDLAEEEEVLSFDDVKVSKIILAAKKSFLSKKNKDLVDLDAQDAKLEITALIKLLEGVPSSRTDNVVENYERFSYFRLEITSYYTYKLKALILQNIKKTFSDFYDVMNNNYVPFKYSDASAAIKFITPPDMNKNIDMFMLETKDFNEVLKKFLLDLLDRPKDEMLSTYRNMFFVRWNDRSVWYIFDRMIEQNPELFNLEIDVDDDQNNYYRFVLKYMTSSHSLSHAVKVDLLLLLVQDEEFRKLCKAKKYSREELLKMSDSDLRMVCLTFLERLNVT
jgi:hypothetical protein